MALQHHAPSSRASWERRSSALASSTAPACSHARAISCSWRSCTTRVPAAAATRSRGSRLSSRSHAGCRPRPAALGAGLQLPVDRRREHVRGRVGEQPLERGLERHARRVRPRRRLVGPGTRSALCVLDHGAAGRQPAAGRAEVERRRLRRLRRSSGLRMQAPDERLEAAGGRRSRTPTSGRPAAAAGRAASALHAGSSALVGHRLAEPGLDAGPERRHEAGQVRGVGLQVARADQPRARRARARRRARRRAGRRRRARRSARAPTPRTARGRAARPAGRVELEHGQRPAGVGVEPHAVLAADGDEHQPRPQPRLRWLPGAAGVNSHGRSARANWTCGM